MYNVPLVQIQVSTTANALLNKAISEEINSIEQSGVKVKLKSIRNKRIIYAMICGFPALVQALASIYFSLIFIALYICIYISTCRKTSNIEVIAKLAKKHRDTPIDEIIRGEMI